MRPLRPANEYGLCLTSNRLENMRPKRPGALASFMVNSPEWVEAPDIDNTRNSRQDDSVVLGDGTLGRQGTGGNWLAVGTGTR